MFPPLQHRTKTPQSLNKSYVTSYRSGRSKQCLAPPQLGSLALSLSLSLPGGESWGRELSPSLSLSLYSCCSAAILTQELTTY